MELQRHNANDMDLCHISLEDLLSGNISCVSIRFVNGDLGEQLQINLREYLGDRTGNPIAARSD
jgi:hypothetical protein